MYRTFLFPKRLFTLFRVHTVSIPTGSTRQVMPAKQKILSILDRARSAMMEESYPVYEEPIYESVPPSHYDSYSYSHAPHHGHVSASRSSRYEVPEYENDYRREYYHREPSSYSGKLNSNFYLFIFSFLNWTFVNLMRSNNSRMLRSLESIYLHEYWHIARMTVIQFEFLNESNKTMTCHWTTKKKKIR